MNLLIHSLEEFSDLFSDLFNIAGVKHICEIGAESGATTDYLISLCLAKNGSLTSIDPSPSNKVQSLAKKYPKNMTLVEDLSLNSIKDVFRIDCWIIDGDHNWYTVYNELRAIENNCIRDNKPFFAILHDVSWPCANRDMYYNPENIPEDYLQQHSWDKSIHLDSKELVDVGFWGAGNFAFSTREGGEKNGILQGIDSFVRESDLNYDFFSINAVFGVGFLIDKRHPFLEELLGVLCSLSKYRFIAALENNRLRNYLKVLELQKMVTY